MFRPAQNYMQGINSYVPAMQWSASVDVQAGSIFSLGRPIAPGTPTTVTFGANDTGGKFFLPTPLEFKDTPYGRNVVVGVTTAPTGPAAAIQVFGEDYLGQPVTEQVVLAGATGKKAFYRVLGMTIVGGSTVAAVLTVVRGALLGLPFKGTIEYAKENNAQLDPGTLFAKCVAPDLTDPATATSGDPRGMYTPTMTPDGIKEAVVCIRVDTGYNANNNGGLHGIRHYNV